MEFGWTIENLRIFYVEFYSWVTANFKILIGALGPIHDNF